MSAPVFYTPLHAYARTDVVQIVQWRWHFMSCKSENSPFSRTSSSLIGDSNRILTTFCHLSSISSLLIRTKLFLTYPLTHWPLLFQTLVAWPFPTCKIQHLHQKLQPIKSGILSSIVILTFWSCDFRSCIVDIIPSFEPTLKQTSYVFRNLNNVLFTRSGNKQRSYLSIWLSFWIWKSWFEILSFYHLHSSRFWHPWT